jgi:hypothetical protein
MKLRVVRANNYSTEEMKRLNRILDLFISSVNSVDFRDRIINHGGFLTDDNLTNDDVYKKIMDGNELPANAGPDEEADLDLCLDFRISTTNEVGFTKTGRIFTFRNKFHGLTVPELAGHYAHEYCHTLGFADPAADADKPRNVPYQVGDIIEAISRDSVNRTFVTSTLPINETEEGAVLDHFSSTVVVPEQTPKKKRRRKRNT